MTNSGLDWSKLHVNAVACDKLVTAKQKRQLRVKKIIALRKSKPQYNSVRRRRSGSGSDSPTSVNSSEKSCALTAAEIRKHERKIRNRQSAINSRMKIRAEVDILRDKISKFFTTVINS
jgi:hypothetical protein